MLKKKTGARYYYYSAILHDWPDAECVNILKIVADAMRPGYSKLLINGIVLRETGATYFEACKDFGMMAAMSAKDLVQRQGFGTLDNILGIMLTMVLLSLRSDDLDSARGYTQTKDGLFGTENDVIDAALEMDDRFVLIA
jgi:hypothetical protein